MLNKTEEKLSGLAMEAVQPLLLILPLTFFAQEISKRSVFSDAALLTCMSNDFGYPEVFSKPVALYADPGDILIAISSSGKSINILNAVKAAREKKCCIITLSGFEADNPLRKSGDYNFYVPSHEYGYVELTHGVLCHSILDLYMKGSI